MSVKFSHIYIPCICVYINIYIRVLKGISLVIIV